MESVRRSSLFVGARGAQFLEAWEKKTQAEKELNCTESLSFILHKCTALAGLNLVHIN